MWLPDGVLARPLADADVDAVVELVNTCELADAGRVMMERADLLSDMGTDGFDRERDVVVIWEGDRLVGWGLIVHHRGRWADVRPDARGRGIGTWLMRWSEDRARELGTDRIGQTIEDVRTDVAAMFAAAGYTPRHTSWILRMDHLDRPPEPELPDGVAVRAFRPGDEEEALTMFEEAFSEFTDRLPSTLATWRAMTIEREGFVPDDLILAVHDEAIVGGAFLLDPGDEIWVDKFAVRRDHRHGGIARAMLHVAFGRSFDRGYDRTTVSTDSRTGALALYERVGMRVVESFTHHAIDL
jgi:GNAT superfamily N-acetyltransferase